jgi:electron transport complex protein RnfB
MESYIYPVVIFIIMGIVFGILLTVLSKIFAVKSDPRTEQITESLPGANCGGCGYAGCADYADAIVTKGAPMNLCNPGGTGAASAIGNIMGSDVSASEKKIPVLHCNGDCNATERAFNFDGIQTCVAAKRFYGGTGTCTHGCLGLGDCASVCPKGCITIKNGIAAICTEECISCGKCAAACPNGLIELRYAKKKVDVICSSKDMGAAAVKACKNSCIACGKCVKACRLGAIEIKDFHAVINYDKCVSCGLCVKECPRGAIIKK